MKRKGLYFLIALALGGVGAVHAQDAAPAPADSAPSMSSSSYDDRWYIAPTIGGYYNDTDRNTNSRQIYYGLGVGRFISPNASIDSRGPSGPSGCHDPRAARSDSFSVPPSSLPAGRRLSLATTRGIDPGLVAAPAGSGKATAPASSTAAAARLGTGARNMQRTSICRLRQRSGRRFRKS